MNILLFGGSFNPPHLGHQFVIEQAFELIPNTDEVWLVPCYGHSFGKKLAPPEDRLAMCRLVPDNNPKIKICPIEIDYKTNGSTYQTLTLLKQETEYLEKTMFNQTAHSTHDAIHYSFLMGSDQIPHFTLWEQWQQLLDEMPFFIYPRGSKRHQVDFPNMILLESPTQIITNISSTLIRERIKNNLPVNHILPPNIYQYLTSHKLYTPGVII